MNKFEFSTRYCFLIALAASTTVRADEASVVRELHALFDSAWERELEDDPLSASEYGDRRYNGLWPDLSIAEIEKRHAADLEVLDDLKRIDRTALPTAERLNYDLFAHQYQQRKTGWPFKEYLYAVNQIAGLQNANEIANSLPFQTVRDYEDWASRLEEFGRYTDQTIALLAQGMREKRMPPKVLMTRIGPQMAQQLVAKAEDSPWYAPLKIIPAHIGAADKERLTARSQKAINVVVVPAYKRFDRFFKEKYLPASRETIGIWDTPDGAAYYRYRVARYTTTSLTAEEIHRTGLKEVARIRGEMDQIIAQVGFKGSLKEFLASLRDNPTFYYKTADELLVAYRATAKQIDPELAKLFGKLPRTPYGVRAVSEASAANISGAYYQPPALDGSRAGYFYANLYKPQMRPKYEIEALVAHEAVPGHHLQTALAQELGELPMFRRTAGYTAYIEGWGLYAESLAGELGFYGDPYSKFGRLNAEMWRALRLVVDTGIHAKHWTRQQAIDAMKEQSGKGDAELATAADRYIAMPGQALAYKIGELEIKRLRAQAETELGEKFAVRGFHDTILSTGAVPLDVLGTVVREWVEKSAAR